MWRLILLFLFSLTATISRGQKNECPADCRELNGTYRIDQLQEMDDEVNESSGLEITSDGNLWTHGDGGTGTRLSKISLTGKMLLKLKLEKLKNDDWEDLARDSKGNLYIGDFGNNKSERQNLKIYKVRESDPQGEVQEINFTFSDQKAYPPAEGEPAFDTEAFFWHKGQLYLFNKNSTCKDYVRVYRLSDKPGTHKAILVDKLQLNSMVSSADISPDGKTVALLGYEELYLLQLNGKNSFSNGKPNCLKIPGVGKTEGLAFTNSTDMIICNEKGMMFKITKIKEKSAKARAQKK